MSFWWVSGEFLVGFQVSFKVGSGEVQVGFKVGFMWVSGGFKGGSGGFPGGFYVVWTQFSGEILWF